METSPRKRIVILGAGFAGLYAALELDRSVAGDPAVEVLLINPQNFLVFTPMLHEVASGSLDPSSIVVPIRQVLRRVQLLQAETTAVDFEARTVTTVHGLERQTRVLHFDYLLLAAGSQTRFPPALRRHVHGMKTIHDALLLRSWLIELLERAELEDNPERRRALLTIVVAGGGFSGVETISAINDFLRDVARHYPRALAEAPALLLVESNSRLLPSFEPALSAYTESRLRAAGIDVRLDTRVAAYDGRILTLDASGESPAPNSLAAHTLIWTAGVAPSPLIESLPLAKEMGRIVVDANMAVPGHDGVWACGDCAAIADPDGKPYPPTAQHAVRQGRHVGANIAAAVRGQVSKIRPFHYRMLGQSAAIGRQRAVASVLGVKFSGFAAWLFWRSAYLFMLPRLDRKLRVFLQWTLEMCFARDTVQLLTVHSVSSGRLEELLDSARAAESASAGAAAEVREDRISDQTVTVR
ncbi:MAG: NAD(P)/FAD-dependent oxidoreductase [Betaproteobacteria bacterium HGW-Betaproteobacteria-7]|jgi:NADH dehydrogenase|nr:MAG: NAD(P)/FAD-dependent oxidoreductase [Betaproteobacteria bacterium HGW-Betaproteobacteria-7]